MIRNFRPNLKVLSFLHLSKDFLAGKIPNEGYIASELNKNWGRLGLPKQIFLD